MITLRRHQVTGKKQLLDNKKYCLFFEVGTGKTFTALAALTELPSCRVLIAAPKRVLERVWKTETNYDLSNYDVTYMNYEKIARDKDFVKNKYDVVILDEVHRLKGRTTKVSKKFRTVNFNATYVWGLTGTPVANNYADVYNIYHNMTIKEFDMNYSEFIQTYYYIKYLDTASGTSFPMLLGVKNSKLGELMYKIGKHSMTVKAVDCIDLPEKVINVVKIKGMVTDKYKEIRDGIFKMPNYEKTMIPLETIQKLHQAANGFVYDAYKNVYNIQPNKKIKEIKDHYDQILEKTDKIIIFYNYQEDYRQLLTLLGGAYLTTNNPAIFETDPEYRIFLVQYQQSEGLNLQFCNHMIFYTYDYSFLNFEQMSGRIFRSGQKRNVTYTILINEDTIEEKIWSAIQNKHTRDQFLKGVLSYE